MLSFKVNIKSAINAKKIQEVASKAAANILVGFPGGMEHVATLHKNEDGEPEGYNGEKPSEVKPIETAELAKMLSFGTSTIPARPFLEEGIMSKKKELTEAMKTQAKKAVNGETPNWGKVGTMAVGAVQEFVRSDYYKTTKPNAPATIKYKGSDMPLIDGGNLVQSVQFIVQEEGK